MCPAPPACSTFPQARAPPRVSTRQPLTTPTQVWSNAGQITLGATNGPYFDGTLVAHGGASQAQGGSLTITDAHFNNYNRSFAAVGILLRQSGLLVPQGLQPGMASPLPSGIEYFAADRLDGSGITQLMLGVDPGTPTANNAGPITIGFAGDVSLSLGQSFIANAANFVALAAGTTSLPGLAGTPALSAGQFGRRHDRLHHRTLCAARRQHIRTTGLSNRCWRWPTAH